LTLKLALLSVMLLLAVVAVPGTGTAQSPISATSSTEVHFPNEITFNLRAESAAPVNQAFLNYRIDSIATVVATAVVELDFDAAPVVVTSWTWEMKKMLGSLPPGTGIRYNWLIRDASGNELETAWQTVEFDDDDHPWREAVGDNVTLYWYQGDLAFGETLLAVSEEALDTLARDTGAELQEDVKVYAYASTEDLQNAMLFPQEWMGGAAFPDYGTLAIEADPRYLGSAQRDLAHEMAHLVTYQMTFNPYGGIPTWLDEGLSMYAEGDLSGSFRTALSGAVGDDTLLSVETISSSFPADFDQARLSYAESYSLVSFLIQQYGRDKMLELLNTFREGAAYDQALLEVYRVDTAGLGNQWRASLGLGPQPSAAPPQTTSTPTTPHFRCQIGAQEPGPTSPVALAVLVLLLMPPTAIAIRFRARRGRK
jgi:hypothetical protein